MISNNDYNIRATRIKAFRSFHESIYASQTHMQLNSHSSFVNDGFSHFSFHFRQWVDMLIRFNRFSYSPALYHYQDLPT